MVYLAEHNLMKRKVAVKLIPPELIGNPKVRERFLQEVVAAAALEHPNVVRAYSAEEFGQYMAFEMEFVDGMDLGQMVKSKGPLPVTNAMNYIRQAAQALQHGMQKSLVHRDIKPSNLLLTHAGSVKVADFGLAKFNRESDKSLDYSLTGANAMMGTPDYMAPEQARNSKSADIRADIYSLGCAFYYLLAGQPPFTGESLADLIFKHWDDPRPDIGLLRDDVPIELSQYIQKMMAKEPGDRPQTPQEVVDWLAKFAKTGTPKRKTIRKPKEETAGDFKKTTKENLKFEEFAFESTKGGRGVSDDDGQQAIEFPGVAPRVIHYSDLPQTSQGNAAFVDSEDSNSESELIPDRPATRKDWRRRRNHGIEGSRTLIYVFGGVITLLLILCMIALLNDRATTDVENPQPKPKAGALTADEATKKVGEIVVVEMRVLSSSSSGDRIFLTSKIDSMDRGNFIIVVTSKALTGKWKNATPSTFRNKVIRVNGTVSSVKKSAQIVVDNEKQLEILEGAK